jgi:D-aspartate ligase
MQADGERFFRLMPTNANSTPAVLLGSIPMLRCFAGTGIRTVLARPDPRDPGFWSRHCRERRAIVDPKDDAMGTIRDLVALGADLGVRAPLYYGDDAMLLALSRGRSALEPYFRFLMPPAEMIEALVDKAQFSDLARERSIPVPRALYSSSVRGPADVLAELRLPVVLKPTVHIGWRTSSAVMKKGGRPRKMVRADTPAELNELYALLQESGFPFLVQEYIPGGDDEIYSFHTYFDENHQSLGHYVGRKIRTYPRDAGVSTYLELVHEPAVVELGTRVLESLDFVGIVKIDFKRDPRTGKFYVLELNPRFNLWNHLGAACGVNLMLLAHDYLNGVRHPVASEYRTGVRWLSLENDVLAFLREYAPAGDLSWRGYVGSLRGPKVYDEFAWDDPLPSLVSLATLSHVVAAKLWRRAERAFGREP